MKPTFRKCPHCGFRYPVKHFIAISFKHTMGQSWDCLECRRPIKFHPGRHLFILALQILLLLAVLINRTRFEGTMWFLVLFIVLIIGYVGLSMLDTFSKGKN